MKKYRRTFYACKIALESVKCYKEKYTMTNSMHHKVVDVKRNETLKKSKLFNYSAKTMVKKLTD